MTERKIYINRYDLERLRALIETSAPSEAPYLEKLENELKKATVVEPREVPGDIVTMNSIVRVKDVNTGEEHTLILVFPGKEGMNGKAVSILSPMGIALIGYREGDILTWDLPTGTVKIQIEEIIYQPERLGNFVL